MPQEKTGAFSGHGGRAARRVYLADVARVAGVSQAALVHYLAKARERARSGPGGPPARLGEDMPLPSGREDTWGMRLYWSDPVPVLAWAERHARRREDLTAPPRQRSAGRLPPGGTQEKTGGFGGHGGRVAEHGTYSGYMMHTLYKIPFPEGTPAGSTGLPPCGCRKANNEYKSAYRERKLDEAARNPPPGGVPPVLLRPPPADLGGDRG